MHIFYILLVLLVATKIFGELAIRLKQPALLGELCAGILIGVIVNRFSDTLPVLAGLTSNEVFIAITDLAIFFLMLLAGLEMHPRSVLKSSKVSLWVALGGMLLPLLSGLALGWYALPASSQKAAQLLFLGTAIAVTAVPVSVRVLMDLKKLHSKEGQVIVSAALIDDFLSLVLLAMLTSVMKTGGFPGQRELLILAAQILLFFTICIFVGHFLLPRLSKAIRASLSDEFEVSVLLMVALGFSVLAEALNMHFIIGAFTAGLFFVQQTVDEEVYKDVKAKISGTSTGFLAPIFFASIGLHLDFSACFEIPVFLLIFIVIAFASKLIGAGLPAYWLGFSGSKAAAIGTAMSARGAVELIIADIALRAGLFSQANQSSPIADNMFSAVVIMAVITTFLAPLLLRVWLSPEK